MTTSFSLILGQVVTYQSDPSESVIPTGSREEWRAEKMTRNYRIWYARERGNTFTSIAKKTGLSVETVRQIWAKEERYNRHPSRRLGNRAANLFAEAQQVTWHEARGTAGYGSLLPARSVRRSEDAPTCRVARPSGGHVRRGGNGMNFSGNPKPNWSGSQPTTDSINWTNDPPMPFVAIPDDVMEVAAIADREVFSGKWGVAEVVARAIMAERERLLSILPKFVDAITAEDIGAAIRKGEA